MPRRNPHAVELGRRGGKADTPLQNATRRANGLRATGRPPSYRMTPDGHLERRHGDRWLELTEPYDLAARAFIRRHR